MRRVRTEGRLKRTQVNTSPTRVRTMIASAGGILEWEVEGHGRQVLTDGNCFFGQFQAL